jgi:hypothetical protein
MLHGTKYTGCPTRSEASPFSYSYIAQAVSGPRRMKGKQTISYPQKFLFVSFKYLKSFYVGIFSAVNRS